MFALVTYLFLVLFYGSWTSKAALAALAFVFMGL